MDEKNFDDLYEMEEAKIASEQAQQVSEQQSRKYHRSDEPHDNRESYSGMESNDSRESRHPKQSQPYNYGGQSVEGTPYWNGIEQDPSGGYRFTGQNQRGYATYNVNSSGSSAQAKKMPGWVKGLIIFAVVCICIIGLGVACTRAISSISVPGNQAQPTYNFSGDYIGVLYLEGTISDGASGDGYNQSWMLERIEQMTDEKNNKGIMLHINTPGGSAYATAEVYDALLNYKRVTGNPIYAYMGSQATSGGYYAAMAADKIYANPECWTGSIGVVVGTLYDLSGLFEKYGIKATNIVSGSNKDMGSMAKPLTDEQLEILQSLVDDSFDRFVKAVVDGRKLSEPLVRKLADGRIYTANQAKENKLIDEVGSLDDALNAMMVEQDLVDVNIEEIYYEQQEDILGLLGFQSGIYGGNYANGVLNSKGNIAATGSDLAILMQLMEESTKVSIEFICPIRK